MKKLFLLLLLILGPIGVLGFSGRLRSHAPSGRAALDMARRESIKLAFQGRKGSKNRIETIKSDGRSFSSQAVRVLSFDVSQDHS